MSEVENAETPKTEVKFYAGENQLSTKAFEGGVEVTEEEYAQCIEAITNGSKIAVRSEGIRILSNELITVYDEDGETIEIPENDDVPEGYSTDKPPLKDEVIIAGIKAEAANRIAASGHDWMAIRKITTGEDVPQAVVDYAAAVRTASGTLESELPQDFYDDKHWPEVIA